MSVNQNKKTGSAKKNTVTTIENDFCKLKNRERFPERGTPYFIADETVATLGDVVENRPHWSESTLKLLGAQVGALVEKKNSGHDNKKARAVFLPLVNSRGDLVDGLVYRCDGKNIGDKPFLLLTDKPGFLCTPSIFNQMEAGQTIISVESADDLISFLANVDSNAHVFARQFVGATFQANNNSDTCVEDTALREGDHWLLRLKERNPALEFVTNTDSRRVNSWERAARFYNISHDAVIFPEEYRGKSISSLSKYLNAGGKWEQLLQFRKCRKVTEIAQSLQSRTGVITDWDYGNLFFSNSGSNRFAFSDDDSPLNNFIVAPGQITAVAGVPASGKTALCNDLVYRIIERYRNLKALVVTAEQSRETLRNIQISRTTRIPYAKIRDRDLGNPEILSRFNASLDEMNSVFNRIFYMDDSSSIDDIVAEAQELDAKILLIDYLQKISINENRPESERIGIVLDRLRELTRQGIAVMLISAVARGSYQSVELDSCRGTSDIEFSVTHLWGLEEVSHKKYNRILKSIKSKEYEKVKIPLLFQGEYLSFESPRIEESELQKCQDYEEGGFAEGEEDNDEFES